jgi:cytochrome c
MNRTLATAALLMAASVTHASEQLMERSGCISCHRVDQKLIGPAFKEVAARYRTESAATEYLIEKIRNGGEGVWGDIPMQPNGVEKISDEDLALVVEWILKL